MVLKQLGWVSNVPGTSRPWRVLAFDSLDEGGLPREFIVKHFRREQREDRIAEYVAARFAFETDIHAIQPEFLVFTPEFLRDLRSLPDLPRDSHLAEAGTHVGFAWNSRAVCLMENHKALYSLEDPGQIGEIIGVDTVLVNFDRSDQNVLFEPSADYRGRPMHQLYPIDWDQSFAGGNISVSNLANPLLQKNQRPWTDRGTRDVMCAHIRSTEDFYGAITKLGGWSAAKARLKLMLQGVPREWDVSESQANAFVDYFLTRVDAVISRLRRPDDPDGVFPNFQSSLSLDSSA